MAKELKINKPGVAIVGALGLVVVVFLIYQTRGGGYVDETVRISELISASISLVEQAGKKVVEVRKLGDKEIGALSKGLTQEGKNEYVTLGDKVCVWPRVCMVWLIYTSFSLLSFDDILCILSTAFTSNHCFWTEVTMAQFAF